MWVQKTTRQKVVNYTQNHTLIKKKKKMTMYNKNTHFTHRPIK